MLGVTRRRLVATDTGFFIRGSGSQKRESRSTPACVGGVRAALSALSPRQVSEGKVVVEREGYLAGPKDSGYRSFSRRDVAGLPAHWYLVLGARLRSLKPKLRL